MVFKKKRKKENNGVAKGMDNEQIWTTSKLVGSPSKFATSLHLLMPPFLPSPPQDEMIWDKLIEKTSSACLREVLLMEPDTQL